MTTLTPINLGTAANNGTGDTLRAGGQKINDNFNALNAGKQELNAKLSAIASSVWLANQVLIMTGADSIGALTTGTTGRALMAANNVTEGRSALALGTAAPRDVMSNTSDTSNLAALMPIGAFGLGYNGISATDVDALDRNGMYNMTGSTANLPLGIGSGAMALHMQWGTPNGPSGAAHQILQGYGGNQLSFRTRHATNGWYPVRNIWHDGNMNPTVLQTATAAQNLPDGYVCRVSEAVYAARKGFGYYNSVSTLNLDNEPGGSVGLYGASTSGTMPSATNWWIETQQTYTGGSRYQMAVSYAGSATTGALLIPKIKMRLSNQPGTAWGAWIDFITSDNVDASVRAALMTGFSPSNSVVVATDSLLAAINKLQGQLNAAQANVRSTPLTGYTPGTNTALAATDTVLSAMGKIQGQINAINTGLADNVRGTLLSGLTTSNSDVAPTDSILVAIGKLQGQAAAATPITRGGTGATTAANARANLGLGNAAVMNAVGPIASSIIERGSNANGEYVRYADGTQICTTGLGSLIPAAGISTHTWTFPAPFVAVGVAQMVANSGAGVDPRGYASQTQYGGVSTTSCAFVVYSASVVGWGAFAIGRWL